MQVCELTRMALFWALVIEVALLHVSLIPLGPGVQPRHASLLPMTEGQETRWKHTRPPRPMLGIGTLGVQLIHSVKASDVAESRVRGWGVRRRRWWAGRGALQTHQAKHERGTKTEGNNAVHDKVSP